MSATISIITTVYNRENFIADAIESVLRSAINGVCEYVIVDDCSSDDSWNIVQEYARQHPDLIRAYRNKSNLGDYGNRHHAVTMCRGDFIKFLDADDMFYEHTLGVFARAIEQFPECSAFLSWNVINPPAPFPFCVDHNVVVRREFLMTDSFIGVGPSAALFSKHHYEAVGGFSRRRHIGDTDLWFRLSKVAKICLVPPALVYWRQHDGQEIVAERGNREIAAQRRMWRQEVFMESKGYFTRTEISEIQRIEWLKSLKRRIKRFAQ